MAERLRLGIIGMSEGNGHPYSWSAIFNGFHPLNMGKCPFPVIPKYLSEQPFPESFLTSKGIVTHVYTQDAQLSQNIALAANIPSVVSDLEEMVPQVDAVLLARDDAENHFEMAKPFLEAGLPIFIDKPLALSVAEAERIYSLRKVDGQIFTCSALRYADELFLTNQELDDMGGVRYIQASTPKYWDTYAVHLIEPIVKQFPERGPLKRVMPFRKNGIHFCIVEWENIFATLKATGTLPEQLKLNYFGAKSNVEKTFHDSFTCFKKSLSEFVSVVNKEQENIDMTETMEIVKIIELGRL